MSDTPLRVARADELTAAEMHDLLRLRMDVFVVEQACAYPDIDGRDTEPGTLHLWHTAQGAVVSTLRVLDDGDTWSIGRVATAPSARGQGLSAELVAEAIARCTGRDIVIGAQTYLEGWYARFGFVRGGEDYLDDGVAHLPMRRQAEGPA